MNYRAFIVLGALLAIGSVACDPYEDEKGGAPAIVAVTLTDSHHDAVDGAGSGSAWAVAGEAQSVLFVHTNKLLDANSVQTSVTDCTPAGNWLTVTGPTPTCATGTTGTPVWYSCYLPSSPTPAEGASVVVFPACEPAGADAGWFDVAGNLTAGTYRVTGQVRDRSGAALPIDVTITAAP